MVQGGGVMVKPKRVGFSVMDEELQQLISANMKIFPVDESFIISNLNPDNFGYVRVTTIGELKNHIYVWDEGWKLIGADDSNVPWGNVTDKPVAYNPIAHTHSVAEIKDLPDISLKVDKVVGKELSENDFTNELKDKLVSLGDSATVDYAEMAERLNTHEENLVLHVTQLEHDAISSIGGKAEKTYVDEELAKKASASTLSGHINSPTIHITQTEKDSLSAHLLSNANPHSVSKSQVGLSNVDNVKQMPIAGGTFTGIATGQANTSYTVPQLRNVILSTASPSGGNNGDIWIKYV